MHFDCPQCKQRGFAPILILIGILVLIIIASGAYYLGKSSVNPIISQPQASASPTSPLTTSFKEDLEERCGKLPPESYPKGQTIIGPFWSPDCRFAASSVNLLGRGGPPPTEIGTLGVYLYNDANKSLNRIYKPEDIKSPTFFKEWTDRENFTFQVGASDKFQIYNYNVIDRKAVLQKP